VRTVMTANGLGQRKNPFDFNKTFTAKVKVLFCFVRKTTPF